MHFNISIVFIQGCRIVLCKGQLYIYDIIYGLYNKDRQTMGTYEKQPSLPQLVLRSDHIDFWALYGLWDRHLVESLCSKFFFLYCCFKFLCILIKGD